MKIAEQLTHSPTDYQRRKTDLLADLKNGDYHLSPSSLNAFIKSPKNYLEYKLKEWEQTDTQRLGLLLENVVFGGEPVSSTFIIIEPDKRPDTDKTFAAQANKAWLAKMKNWAKSQEKNWCTSEEINQCVFVRDAIFADPIASTIFNDITETQKKVQWKRCGIDLVGYIDAIGNNILLEFKSTRDANYGRFQWDCRDYGYDYQIAMYADVTAFEEVYLIAADWGGNVSIIRYQQETLDRLIFEYQEYLERFKECIESNAFERGYSFHKPVIWR